MLVLNLATPPGGCKAEFTNRLLNGCLFFCGQDQKDEKPQAANDTGLSTVTEDLEPAKEVAASAAGSPMLEKPGAARPKGSEHCTSVVHEIEQ